MASKGYLLIADLSGYTSYLTSTEFDHANGVIRALLEVLVTRLEEPLRLWRLEGDAVLAYSLDPDFPSGETVLTICEDLYNAFRARRLDIEANSTCECRACAQVPDLDLKVILHHGQFEEMQVGPLHDISGPDAILVHRMPKTGVAKATGIKSYALLSEAAFESIGAPEGLTSYAESLEPFGHVPMKVYDLAAAWNRVQQARDRVYVTEEEAVWTYGFHLAASPRIAWEILVSARTRKKWMNLISIAMDAPAHRAGPGARFHCVHEIGEFTSWIADWEPFSYHTNRYVSVLHPQLCHYETYELVPAKDGGTDIRYRMAPLIDFGNRDAGPFPDESAELREAYKGVLAPMWEELSKNVASDPSVYG